MRIYLRRKRKKEREQKLCAYLMMVMVELGGVVRIVAGAELEDVRERRDEEEQ